MEVKAQKLGGLIDKMAIFIDNTINLTVIASKFYHFCCKFIYFPTFVCSF